MKLSSVANIVIINIVEYIYIYQKQKPMMQIYFVSSEGALYVILPYDYQAAARPLFEHTPVLNNNFEYWCHDDFVDCDFYDD